jgi:pSer/pThr/pTyr-binding forkhead associated (FHA) protein
MNVTMTIKLLVIQGKPQGKCLQFRVGRDYMFGRGAECHIQVHPKKDWVSRQHCLLRVTPEGTFLRDLGSRNGTLVNGVRLVGERQLTQGDQFMVGPLLFEVDLNSAKDHSEFVEKAKPEDTRILLSDTAEMALVTNEVVLGEVDKVSPTRSDHSLLVPPQP